MKLLQQFSRELFFVLCVGISIWLSSRALFHEGFFRTIDDVTTVRIDHLARELSRGYWMENFPVRLAGELAHHYGYFFYLFYAPLVYYAGAVLMLFGDLSPVMATKAVYVFPLLIGPLLFYWSARQKLAKFPAAVGAVFFALFPYRGFDAYFRGGVGENWAIALIPALFAGIFMLEKKERLGGLITALTLALIMIAHNIAAVIIVPITLLYGLVFLRRNLHFWLSLLLGLGLSAFFWLPSLYYLQLIGANDIELNTTYILSTLLPLWEIIKPDISYTASQSFVPTFFYLIMGGLILYLFKKRDLVRTQGLFWFALSLLLYLLLAEPMRFFWQLSLPITRTFQFSWRVLIFLSFTIPLCISYLLAAVKNRVISYLLATLCIVQSLTFLPSFKPAEYSYFYAYSADDSSPCGTASFDEYFPTWVKECVNQDQQDQVRLVHGGVIHELKNEVINIELRYSSDGPNRIMVHKYYFPGWRVLVDGQEVPIDYQNTKQGIIEANLPPGTHQVKIYYSKTSLMWVSDLITLSSIIIYGLTLTATLRQRKIG